MFSYVTVISLWAKEQITQVLPKIFVSSLKTTLWKKELYLGKVQ